MAVGCGLICHLQAALGSPTAQPAEGEQGPVGSTGGTLASVLRVRATAREATRGTKTGALGQKGVWGKTLTRVLQAQRSRRPRNSEVPTGEPEGRPGPGLAGRGKVRAEEAHPQGAGGGQGTQGPCLPPPAGDGAHGTEMCPWPMERGPGQGSCCRYSGGSGPTGRAGQCSPWGPWLRGSTKHNWCQQGGRAEGGLTRPSAPQSIPLREEKAF